MAFFSIIFSSLNLHILIFRYVFSITFSYYIICYILYYIIYLLYYCILLQKLSSENNSLIQLDNFTQLFGGTICLTTHTKYGIRNTKYEIRSTKYEIRNTEYEIRNTKYEIRGTKYEVRNTKYDTFLKYIACEANSPLP